MKRFYKMSGSEMEIMKVIWELAAPVTLSQLLSIFESKEWKIQTLATFLTRLSDKGLIAITKRTKGNIYAPTITEQKYRQLEAQNLLDSMYSGSLQGFLSALYNGGEVNAREVEELREWFEKVGEND